MRLLSVAASSVVPSRRMPTPDPVNPGSGGGHRWPKLSPLSVERSTWPPALPWTRTSGLPAAMWMLRGGW